MKRVLIFGTFDALHPGHLSFLKQARRKGKWLIASVARDDYVRVRKNREPLHHEGERITRLLATGLVDQAYLSDEDVGTFRIIERSNPDVVCFGHDQSELKKNLETWLKKPGNPLRGKIETYTLKAHRRDRFNSSQIISRHRGDD